MSELHVFLWVNNPRDGVAQSRTRLKWLSSSNSLWCWTPFHVSIGHLYVFAEMSIYIFCPVFDWVVYFSIFSCMSYLHVLEINPLSVAWFANIFSHSVGCLFILLMAYFAVWPHLFTLHLVYFCYLFFI